MNATANQGSSGRDRVWQALNDVPDPEIPVLSVLDLGIVRGVVEKDTGFEVVITPTYTGCPAMDTIESDIRTHLEQVGLGPIEITTVLDPPWTTAWLSQEGREKLRAYGIAPPNVDANSKVALLAKGKGIACPRCGSLDTQRVSEFGSTPCKAHYRCNSCLEPFDYFKCI